MSNPPQSDTFAERRRPVTQIRYFSIHAVLPGRGDTESVRCRLIRPFDSLRSALKGVRKNTPRCAECCMERMKGIAPHSQCECAARLGDDIFRARHFGVRAITPGRGDTESVRCRLIRPFDSLRSALKGVRKNTPRCAECCMERMKGIAPHSQCECAARLGDDIFRARHFGVRAITPGRGDTESVRCRLIRPFDSLRSALKGVRKNTPRCAGCRMERMKGIEPSTAAWEAAVLPLNYIRIPCVLYFITTERFVNSMRVFRA